MILPIVSNKALVHPENLLLNSKTSRENSPENEYFGEVNTGRWFKEAKRHERRKPYKILMSFCHFIDH